MGMRARAVLLLATSCLFLAGCDKGGGASGGDQGGGDDAAAVGDGATDSQQWVVDDAGSDGYSPGGSVPPTSGGITSSGRVPDPTNTGTLPNGAAATVTEDGFEFGETLCSGTVCVTGGITP
jgi:hypothetical protein